ncbi:hypothetical protein JIN85_17100 [Luteolibacter pohnpeiensis]|uniref:Uncharacterized protein n=1 Tax=Luteolibacter pohnpeiensis TaxID=454153 RepID=A0A934S7J8_9BACT|nr:hypothetical protein [Luteolibacter pohnpeiensis]MBK1884141.1 hypothetical protein [Luteolibacter pohnpeiensis]
MSSDDEKATWVVPAKTVALGDGTFLIKPGKPVLRARATVVANMTGISLRTLCALADCGLIRRVSPSPRNPLYYPGEVEALLARTEAEPDFWNDVRSKAFLTGTRLDEAEPEEH